MSHPSGDCDEEYIIVNIFKINIDNDYKNNMTGIGIWSYLQWAWQEELQDQLKW